MIRIHLYVCLIILASLQWSPWPIRHHQGGGGSFVTLVEAYTCKNGGNGQSCFSFNVVPGVNCTYGGIRIYCPANTATPNRLLCNVNPGGGGGGGGHNGTNGQSCYSFNVAPGANCTYGGVRIYCPAQLDAPNHFLCNLSPGGGSNNPPADDTGSLGQRNLRWAEVYGVTGSFNNSVLTGTLAAKMANIATSATIGGTLTVTGTCSVGLLNAGNTEITGTLGVTGTSSLAAVTATTLGTSGLATLNSASVTNNLGVGGTSALTGVTATTLATSGLATLNSASVTSTLGVSGISSLAGVTATTLSTSSIAALNSASVTNALSVGTTLTVDGASTLASVSATTLGTSGLATLNSASITTSLFVGGTTTFNGLLTVDTLDTTGLATLDSASVTTTLGVTGASTLASVSATSLTTSGPATLDSADITNALGVGTTLEVMGESTLAGVSATTLDTSGLATLNSILVSTTLQVDGTSTLASVAATTLGTSGLATLNSASVTNGLSVGSTLGVVGLATLSGGLSTTTVTSSGLATLESLSVSGMSILGQVSISSLTVAGTPFNPYTPSALTQSLVPAVANTLTIGTAAKPFGEVHTDRLFANVSIISSSLSDIGTVIAGALIVNTTALVKNTLTVDGTSFLLDGVSTTSLATSGLAVLNSLAVLDGTTLGTTLSVLGTSSLAGVSATTATISGLATLNSASVTTTLGVGGTSTLAGVMATTLGTSGAATLNSLAVTNGATVGTTLGVGGASTLQGVSVTTLSSSGLATLNSASVTNGVIVGTTLNVAGTSTLAGVTATTLSTSGLATLNSASVTTTLGVSGASTLTTMSTSGAATLNSASVTNALSVGSTLSVSGTSTLAAVTATTLSTSGLATLNSASITGSATIGTTLGVSGSSTLAAVSATTLSTSSLATLNSASVTTTLGVSGSSTLQAVTATTLGTSGLATLNSASITTTLGVSGTSTLAGVTASTLSTSGLATLGSASVGSTLSVTGTSTLAGASATTLATSGLATLNSLAVTNAATVGSTLGVTGASTLAGVSATTLTTSGLATLNSASVTTTLGVTGTSTLGATSVTSLTIAGTPFSPLVPGALTQSLIPAMGNTLTVGTLAKPFATIYTTRLYANFSIISASLSDTGTVIAGALVVNRTALVKGALTVDGTSDLAGGVGTTILSTSSQALLNSAVVTTTLAVDGASTLTTLGTSGLATLNSASVTTTLGVTGASTLSTLSTSGLATLNSASVTSGLTVSGTSTLAGVTATTLGTSGLATLNSASVTTTLGVTGASTFATLSTSGLATLNSASITTTLGVTGASTLSTLGTSGLATLNSASVTNGLAVGGTVSVSGASTVNTINSNQIVIRSTLASTGQNSGALMVAGGVAINGSLNVAGTIHAAAVSYATLSASGQVLFTAGIPSASDTTGTLVITGGLGVSGAINTAGNIVTSGFVAATGNLYGDSLYMTTSTTGTDPQIVTTASRTGNTAVQNADPLTTYAAYGYDGTTQQPSTIIESVVSGTVGAGIVPGTMIFKAASSTGSMTNSLIVSAATVNIPGITLEGGTSITYYNLGTITQTGSYIIGSGTTFTSAMVGGQVYIAAFSTCTITAVISATNISCSVPQTISTASAYSIAYNLGGVGYGISPTGNLLLQPSSGSTAASSVTAIQIFPNSLGGGSSVNIDISTRSPSVNYPNARLSWVGNNIGEDFHVWSKLQGSDLNPLKNWFSVLATGQVQVQATTASGSPTTGALIVSGGLGVAGVINTGGNIITTGSVNALTVTATATTGIGLAVSSTAVSTSTTTGALTVAGGLGVAGAVTIGGVLSMNSQQIDNSILLFNGGNVGTNYGFGMGAAQMVYSIATGATFHGFYAGGHAGTLLMSIGGNGVVSIPGTLSVSSPITVNSAGVGTTALGINANGPNVATFTSTSSSSNNQVGITLGNSLISPSGLYLSWDTVHGVSIFDEKTSTFWLQQGGTTAGRVATLNNILDNGVGQATFTVAAGSNLNVITITQPSSLTSNNLAIQFVPNGDSTSSWSFGTDFAHAKNDDFWFSQANVGPVLRLSYNVIANTYINGAVSTLHNVLDNGSGAMSITSSGSGVNGLIVTANAPISAIFTSTSLTSNDEAGIQIQTTNAVAPNGMIVKWDSSSGMQITDKSGGAWLSQGGTTVSHIQTANNVLDNGSGSMAVAGSLSIPTAQLFSVTTGTYNMYSAFAGSLHITSGANSGSINLGDAFTGEVVLVHGTSASTATTNGALVVTGGLGVGGAINAGAASTITSAVPIGLVVNGPASSNVDIELQSAGVAVGYFAYSPTLGVFMGNGAGAAILYQSAGITTGLSLRTTNNVLDNGSGAMLATGSISGLTVTATATTGIGLAVSSTATSSSSTTGALVVTGGLGVGGAINAGGAVTVTAPSAVPGIFIATSTTNSNEAAISISNSNVSPSGLNLRWDSSNGIQIIDIANSGVAWLTQGGTTSGRVATKNGNVLDNGSGAMTVTGAFTGTTGTFTSTSTIPLGVTSTTGTNSNQVVVQLSNSALANSGFLLRWDTQVGIQIQDTINGGVAWLTQGGTSAGRVVTKNGNVLDAGTSCPGCMFVSSGTPSTSPSTGALVVSGGLGVAGTIYAGGFVPQFVTIAHTSTAITAAQSGTVFLVGDTTSTSFTITLPTTPPLGTYYKFYFAHGSNAGQVVTITCTTTNCIYGASIAGYSYTGQGGGTFMNPAAASTTNLNYHTNVQGDWVEYQYVVANGWMISGAVGNGNAALISFT